MAISRRTFLKFSMIGAISWHLQACSRPESEHLRTRFRRNPNPNAHLLRTEYKVTSNGETVRKKIVIVGGGVAGLTALYELRKQGENDVCLLEMAEVVGGNAQSGENAYSRFPWGAHYLTQPNPNNVALIQFLREQNIVTGFDDLHRPIYDEFALCQDPEERLKLRGSFQSGLVPNDGNTRKDAMEFERFFAEIEHYKHLKGKDGAYFFEIPSSLRSADNSFDYLDQQSFTDYLSEKKYHSEKLHWYLRYCCRDDFGAGPELISAWAGINYFASHRADPANTDPSRVLTWPEGNAHLVDLLKKSQAEYILPNKMVRHVSIKTELVSIIAQSSDGDLQTEFMADRCILCTPAFVTSKILHPTVPFPFDEIKLMQSYPWLVATLTLSHLPESLGTGLCWDNVDQAGSSLGYIYDQHQSIQRNVSRPVLTLYYPLSGAKASEVRKLAKDKIESHWQALILTEMNRMHPGISATIEDIELCIWGHAMIAPSVGLSKNEAFTKLRKGINGQLYFAHSDYSAYSIFEEAFDQGYTAANLVLKTV